jgi:serine/threonine-protein kinase
MARLGQGGMAEVFLAVVAGPAGFSKLHVIKVMKPELLEENENRAMFLDEGKLAARLNHPNIVQTYEVQIEGEQYFMAMEYLDGQPLHRVLRRSAKEGSGFPLHWHIHVLCEVLAALEHAHELCDYDGTPLKVVHRDVTPHNVFVTYAGQVKLCDFGIAKTMTSSVETRAGILKGKVSYMAPEQVLGSRLDHRADLFSVAVMLWEAATGERIWAGQSELHIMQALCDGLIPRVHEINPDIDPELRQIIDRGLASDPKQRWQTAGEFRRALENWVFSNTARVDPRAVGEWISNLFAKERQKLQGVIQQQMNERHGGPPPAFDSLLPPRMGASTGESSRSQRAPNSSSAEPAQTGAPQSSLTIPSVEVRAIRPRRTLAAAVGVFAALGIFVVIGVSVLVIRRAHSDRPDVEAAEPRNPHAQPAGEAPPAPTPAAVRVRIRVKVSPEDAKLTLDGNSVPNPLVIERTKDDQDHTLFAEAPGHESETRVLRFEQSLDLDFSLKAVTAAKKTSAPMVAPATTKKDDQPDIGSVKKKPPPTVLDKDDPWK